MATTLALAEQNHAEELKRVCLEYVSKHLSLVIASEGYQHMVNSCPQLQVQLPTLFRIRGSCSPYGLKRTQPMRIEVLQAGCALLGRQCISKQLHNGWA